MKGTLAALACLALALSLASPRIAAAEDTEIGYVAMQGYLGAVGERASGETEQLTYKRDVYSQETVRTGAQSMTALRFLDDTTLQVSQHSEVVLDRFIYDEDKRTGQVVIEFTVGVFRFVTGEMTNLEGFELRTPTALIGIRGTDFKVGVDESGATTVAVKAGEVEVTSRGGEGSATAAAGQSTGVSSTGDVSGVSAGDAVGGGLGLGDSAAEGGFGGSGFGGGGAGGSSGGAGGGGTGGSSGGDRGGAGGN